jgi:hypothetical protein
LKGTNFDELLLSIDNVPFLGTTLAKTDISSLEEAIGVEGLCICIQVFEIATCNNWTPKTKLPYSVESRDVFTIVVDDPFLLVSMI